MSSLTIKATLIKALGQLSIDASIIIPLARSKNGVWNVGNEPHKIDVAIGIERPMSKLTASSDILIQTAIFTQLAIISIIIINILFIVFYALGSKDPEGSILEGLLIIIIYFIFLVALVLHSQVH